MSQLKKYKKIKYLGKGSYGAALLVELKSNPLQKFVIKEIIIGHLKEAEQVAAKNEAEVLNQLSHSNITMYVESFVEASKLYIVMEYADGGDLSASIQRRKSAGGQRWTEEEVMRIFVQICLALKHVHDANILHRDLKSQNIFLTTKEIVKLGDFGIAKVLDASEDQARTQIGTPYYLSPEICESKPYGRKSDVWSLGVVLFELSALEMPFQASSLPALVHRIVSTEPSYTKVQSNYSTHLVELIKCMLLKNPDKRPTLKEIVKTDYIKTHISKLLSYTLKAGTGGAAPSITPGQGNNMPMYPHKEIDDPEEADRNIEKARQQQREHEKRLKILERENQILQERQNRRNEEIEKLKKFKQDMMRRNEKGGESEANTGAGAGELDFRRHSEGDDSPVLGKGEAPVVINQYQHRQLQQRPRSLAEQYSSNVRQGGGVVDMQQQGQGLGLGRNANAIQQPMNRNASNDMNQAMQMRVPQVAPARSNLHNNSNQVQQIQQAQQNEYESFARREYYANRAAAQAAKQRFEAYERESNRASPVHVNTDQPQPMQQPQPMHVHELKDKDRDRDVSGEERLAQMRALKEREREEERVERERQLQQAHVVNRELNRELNRDAGSRRKKAAVVFEVDFSEADNILQPNQQQQPLPKRSPQVAEAVPRPRLQMQMQVKEVEGEASPGVAVKKKGWDRSRVETALRSEDIAQVAVQQVPVTVVMNGKNGLASVDNSSSGLDGDSGSGKEGLGVVAGAGQWHGRQQRKGWAAPPADPGMFKVPAVGGMIKLDGGSSSVSADDVSIINDTSTVDGDVTGEDDFASAIIMQRLEARQISAEQARKQARDVFRKLREQKKSESNKQQGKLSLLSPRSTEDSKDVLGAVVYNSNAKVKVKKGISNIQNRLNDVLNQVERASESVQKVISAVQDRQQVRKVQEEELPLVEENNYGDELFEDEGEEDGGSASASEKMAKLHDAEVTGLQRLLAEALIDEEDDDDDDQDD